MSFNSLHFVCFFIIVLAVHSVLPHRFRWIWLLGVSYYFYMSWNAWLIFLIVGTTGVSYVSGLLMARTRKKSTKKLLLVLTLVTCLGTLAFFKYFNFLMSSVIDFFNLFSMNIDSFALDIILPIGISFYTFQTLSYVIDVYRGKFAPEKHFGYYALFVSFFPQLVAGPIERPDNLIPQLRAERKVTADDMEQGLRMLIRGFFKKVAIADFVGAFVNSAFGAIAQANGLSLWMAAMLFTVQIYCDFSGYSDIATGCARMMGIKLMKNFDRPLAATSMREYGRRWHISLNSWFMEYVYFPLGGSRKGKLRKYINILIVFTLSGLWHGAAWTFVIWGALIGVYTIAEDLLRPHYRKICARLHINNANECVKMIRRIVVLSLVAITSVFFRAQSVSDAGLMLTKMFCDWGVGSAYVSASLASLSMTILDGLQLVCAIALLVVSYNMCFPKEGTLFAVQPHGATVGAARASVYLYFTMLVVVAWIIAVSSNDASAFIYFQF